MKRATVIINPISGGLYPVRRTPHKIRLAETTLSGRGFDPQVHVTRGPHDAHEVALQAVRSGVELIVAWGGDGTINEVASALAFSSVPLGIVPAGSGNGLARELGLPPDPASALTVAAGTSVRVLDAGEIENALFFNVAGVGLDATIAARFAARGSRRRGVVAYLQLTTVELLRQRGRRYSLRLDGRLIERRAVMIALANARQYGNGVTIAPRARPDDGLIDVVVVDEQSLFSILTHLPALFRGTLEESETLLMRPARNLEIAADGPLAFHVDGEPRSGGSLLRVRVRPQAIHVRVAESS